MAKLVIRNTHPQLDGEYELDLTGGFTKAEYYEMKKRVGVVLADFVPGAPADANVTTAWALVALRRARLDHLFNVYLDTTDEQTEWQFDAKEVGEDPAVPPASGPSNDGSQNGRNDSSGDSTNVVLGGYPETNPPATGSQP